MSKNEALINDDELPSDSLLRSSLLVLSVAAVVSIPFLLGGGVATLSRPLWFDELLTYVLVADDSPSHSLQAIADGVDYNPPMLHLSNRLFAFLFGGPSEFSLRLFALLSMVLALAGLYLILRTSWEPLVCLVAIFALNCQPLIVDQASQARFYGPWCASAVWFAWFLLRVSRSENRAAHLALAISSVALCTIHYFGVIALMLISLAHFWRNRRPCPRPVWGFAAILTGPLALLACTPFYLGQRAALTVPTWIDPPDLAQINRFLGTIAPLTQLALVATLAYLCITFLPRKSGNRVPTLSATVDEPFAGLAGLVALPAVLLVFSWLVQPAMVPRYATVSVLAFAPVLAWLAARIPRPLLALLLVWFCLSGAFQWMAVAAAERRHAKDREQLAEAIRNSDPSVPVLFEDKLTLFPLLFYSPDIQERCFYLDFEPEQISRPTAFRLVSRDVVRSFSRHYDHVRLFELANLNKYPRLLVVPIEDDLSGRKEFQSYNIRRYAGGLFELEASQP